MELSTTRRRVLVGALVMLLVVLLAVLPFCRKRQVTPVTDNATIGADNATLPANGNGTMPATGNGTTMGNATLNVAANGTIPDSASPNQPEVITGVVEDGDTAGKLLGELMPQNKVHEMLEATRKVYSLTMIRKGQPYIAIKNATTANLERFEYEIDSTRKLVVDIGDSYKARVENIRYDYELAKVEGAIESHLFQAVADAGETPTLAILLADIFAWEVDFIRDLRAGDSFTVLVEKRFRDGEFKGYGKMLAASFTNQGTTYEAFLFVNDLGMPAHYNPKGESLRKSFLKAPLSFTRISSGFSNSRLHPIFMERRAHPGVDYAAPTGTPVKAVGDGVVTGAGWSGGYGNQVILKHSNGYESMYSHLSGFSKSAKRGARIRQGEVIGYVGATGWATGPHLDFRLRSGGTFLNPTKLMNNPRSTPVPKNKVGAFRERMEEYRGYLNGGRSLSEYVPKQDS